MNQIEEFRNKIDDYEQTIHAIVGFMNFYRYDDFERKMKDDVVVFQGRKLEPSPEKAINPEGHQIQYLTPDIGILLPSKIGIIGEVKKSFPSEQEYWIKTFEQLMSYDDNLKGWPSEDEKVNSHDIVLLLHQTRANRVKLYYESKRTEIKFERPFTIIQFNRSNERQSYYFFQNILGSLSNHSINEKLIDGISVPMMVFVKIYSTVKIYDNDPPLPYLIDIIWTNVVLPYASKIPQFEKLRKNQKIEVELEIDKIVEELYQGFSFKSISSNNSFRQPKVPKREWIVNACEVLVKSSEARWIDASKSSIKILFRKYDNTLEHFIEICSLEMEKRKQMNIFENKETEQG